MEGSVGPELGSPWEEYLSLGIHLCHSQSPPCQDPVKGQLAIARWNIQPSPAVHQGHPQRAKSWSLVTSTAPTTFPRTQSPVTRLC